MKRYKFILTALGILLPVFVLVADVDAQTIAGAEYFIDEDPGVGSAISLDPADGVYDANTEEAEKVVDTSSLSVGPHVLGVRFRKSDGTWSYTRKTWFYVTGERTLTGAEWFINEDPGKGTGNPIDLPTDGEWDEPEEEVALNDIDISGLEVGDPDGHTIFVRFCDSDGNWGLTRRATFEVYPDLYITDANWTAHPPPDPLADSDTWKPMYAEDGAFDEPNEVVIATGIDPNHDCVYVRVQDNLGRWSTRHGLVLKENCEWIFDPLRTWNQDNVLLLNSCFPCYYSTYGDFLEYKARNKDPDCWCGPPYGSGYQCDGDADGATETWFDYRVYGNDLALVVENWKMKIDDPNLNPCADIDHLAETFFEYRVYGNDLAIVVANWKKKDRGDPYDPNTQLPGDCPRPE